MVAPALIHFALNAGTPTQVGFGIPMATDIAFPLGVLAILGSRVPASLRVFVVAFAVIDDLGARFVIIALFYTASLSVAYLAGALAVWFVLLALNRLFRVASLVPYLLGGVLLWLLVLKSGVHPTIAGVLLALAVPFGAGARATVSASQRLEHFLQKPAAFVILPLFALANTGIVIGSDWVQGMASTNSAGIVAGLALGKPVGVTLLTFAAVAAGVCCLPSDLSWRHIMGAGILGGIGFTIAIFITNLAYSGSARTASASKLAILLASLVSGLLGYVWLRSLGNSDASQSTELGAAAAGAPPGAPRARARRAARRARAARTSSDVCASCRPCQPVHVSLRRSSAQGVRADLRHDRCFRCR